MWQNNFRCQYFAKISNVSRKAGWIKCWTSVLFGQRLNCSTASSPALPCPMWPICSYFWFLLLASCPVLSCPVDWCLHPSLRTLQMLLLRVKVLRIEHVSTSGRCQCSHRSFIQGAWMTFQYQIHVLSAKKKQNLVPSLASRCLNDFVGENSDFKHNGYNQYCLKAIQKSPASIVYFNIRRTVWCVNCVSSLY